MDDDAVRAVPAERPDTARCRDRSHRGPGRPHRVNARFNAEELAAVDAAATREGRTPAGFCAEAALAAARGATSSGPGSAREAVRQLQLELFAARTAVNRFGTNVNQVAAAYNATGELPEYARAAIELCARSVARLDEVTIRIRDLLR